MPAAVDLKPAASQNGEDSSHGQLDTRADRVDLKPAASQNGEDSSHGQLDTGADRASSVSPVPMLDHNNSGSVAQSANAGCEESSQLAPSLERRDSLILYPGYNPTPSAQPTSNKTFMKYLFGIGPEDRLSGVPKSKLIEPLSIFSVCWVFLTSACLLYTAFITPFMIAYYWLDDPCTAVPTLPLDVVIDTFFIVDIIIHFNTGM